MLVACLSLEVNENVYPEKNPGVSAFFLILNCEEVPAFLVLPKSACG